MWKFNNMLQNDYWINEEIKGGRKEIPTIAFLTPLREKIETKLRSTCESHSPRAQAL